MEGIKKKKFYWRKLDNQAKVFSLVASKGYSSVFRLSVVLKEKIDSEILGKAVQLALEKYKAFRVRMRKGFFWHYFEENTKEPVITVESEYPFKKVNTKNNNYYLFKITYYEKKINIEFFHTLTDGNSGAVFIKEIIYKYLELKYPSNFLESIRNSVEIIQDSEDSYIRNYKKQKKPIKFPKRAYMLQGKKFEDDKVAINHFIINLEDLKAVAKSNEATISIYLTAMIIYSIYEANYKINKGKNPIKICVPIDLKKYFPSNTMSNFFTYMKIEAHFKNYMLYSFDNILGLVKEEFEKKLTEEELLKTMSADVRLTNNPIIKIMPLCLKEIAVKLGSKEVKRHFTMSFSNIGKIEIDENYKGYIEEFIVMIAPDWAEKTKCAVCSFENKLVFTFATILRDNLIEKRFYDFLVENNIDFKVEGNGVKDVISQN